jgi:hypothetical protein
MRRLRLAVATAGLLIITLPAAAGAAGSRAPGFLPPTAHPLGHSMAELAGAWNVWGFGSAADVNPLLAVRCEQSSLDPRIWFLPVSLGGEYENTCNVPRGSFLVLNVGGAECSNIEPEPFFGADEADLKDCVKDGFDLVSYAEVTARGITTKQAALGAYAITSALTHLPANNLLSADAGISMDKGYFMVIGPLSPGTHTFHAYDEFAVFDFKAGITYTINVGG